MLNTSPSSKGTRTALLAPVPVTEESNGTSDRRGEKRQLSLETDFIEPEPVTEEQLTILKDAAKQVIKMLEEILDLEFVKGIQRKHICNFTSARGDLLHYLKRISAEDSQPVERQRSQSRTKRPRRVQSNFRSINRLDVARENRLQGRERVNNMAPSWPRPSPWLRKRTESFNQPIRRQWPNRLDSQQPYSRRSPESSLSNARGGDSEFLRNDSYQNSVSRGYGNRLSRSNLRSAGGLGPRNGPRSNAGRMRTRGSVRSKFKDDVYSRCELCNVNLRGESSVKQHMAGKRHRAALAAQQGGLSSDDESGAVMHEITIGDDQ